MVKDKIARGRNVSIDHTSAIDGFELRRTQTRSCTWFSKEFWFEAGIYELGEASFFIPID